MGTESKIKLYDLKTSPNCQRVRVVLEEKILPYDTIPVDLTKKEQKRAEFLKLNPYGKIPVMIDGEVVLYESCIINEYLEDRYPDPPLMPKEPAKRAKIRLLIDYALNHLHPTYWRLREQMMLKKEQERDPKIVEETKNEIKHLLQKMEQEIENQPYLAGEFSLLDVAVIPRFLRLESWGLFQDSRLPRLKEWLKRMKRRPSVGAIIST